MLARSDCGSFLYSHSSTLPATALLGKLTSHLTFSVCGADLEAGRAEMVITRHGRERDNGISFLREPGTDVIMYLGRAAMSRQELII